MNKKFLLLTLLCTLGMASCGVGGNPSSSNTSSNTSSTTTSQTSSAQQVQTVSIASVRTTTNVDEVVAVKGVVVKHNYTGQSTPYITGFWIADETGSIYVYGENSAKTVSEGNEVVVRGKKCFYIPQNDTGAASTMNYQGMMQLKEPEIISNDKGTHAIPTTAIIEKSIAEINQIPLSENITGNIYKVKGRYSMSSQADFTNYYIEDLNRVDSLMAYTQSNGKDYAWTNSYDGKTVEMLMVASIAKPGVNSWRFCPVAFLNDSVTVSDEEEAIYALDRAASNFGEKYDVDTTVEISKNDPKLSGATISVSSTSSQITVTEELDVIKVTISVSQVGVVPLTVSVSYEGVTKEKVLDIELEEKVTYQTTPISEVRTKNDGEVVTIEAIVAKITYKSSMVKQGLFLVDETGSMFAYFNNDPLSQLTSIEEGNKIILTATVAHYIKNASNAANANYSGDFQLTENTILNVDKNKYEIPVTSYSESSIATIMSTPLSTNLTGNIYKVTCKVVRNDGQYKSYSLFDVNDTTVSLPLYSQVSGSDFTWLDPYNNQEVTMLVAVQNLNLKSDGSFYRGCPICVL